MAATDRKPTLAAISLYFGVRLMDIESESTAEYTFCCASVSMGLTSFPPWQVWEALAV